MRTEELESEARKLVDFINSLGLQIPRRAPPHKHIGAIIADAVLQIVHRYNEQVRDRILNLRDQYPETTTTSGFLHALKTVGAQQLLDGWKGEKEHKRLYDHAEFFVDEGVETFENLIGWLRKKKNKSKLISAGLGIKDRTADYYCVLVGLPDAVKVDSRVEEFLSDSGINIREHEYNELRAIVQAAAKRLGKRPIDLEGAIWNYQVGNRKGVKMRKGNDEDELKVLLPLEKMEQLKTVSQKVYGDEPANVAKFWIMERLHQLRISYESYPAPQSRDIASGEPQADIHKGTKTRSKPRREMVRETVNTKAFRSRSFSKEELCKAMEAKYGPINRSSFILTDWCVNRDGGPLIKDANGKLVAKYPYLFSPKRGIFTRYDPNVHGR